MKVSHLKKIKEYLNVLDRSLNFREYSLPDFLIIGGQKCGTTSLYSYLIQHPGIISAERKEVHYFNNPHNRSRGKSWYSSHFCTLSDKNRLAKKIGYLPITGEATPAMHNPFVPGYVFELLPSAKLIAMIRNPIDRAFSHYHHSCRNENLTLSFEEAIAQSAFEVSPERANNESLYRSSDLKSYITRGLYAEQFHRWYQYYPPDRIHIVNSEDFFVNPQSECKKILQFLEMPDYEFDGIRVSKHAGNYETRMNSEIREYLTAFFRPHNKYLFDLIGRDLGWPA